MIADSQANIETLQETAHQSLRVMHTALVQALAEVDAFPQALVLRAQEYCTQQLLCRLIDQACHQGLVVVANRIIMERLSGQAQDQATERFMQIAWLHGFTLHGSIE